jgi:Phage tail assembly chaperone protein
MEHVIVNATTGETTVVPFTSEELAEANAKILELAWKELRDARNSLLASSDWTQVKDAPVDQEAWAVYRQALRDLPSNTQDPLNVIWPSTP